MPPLTCKTRQGKAIALNKIGHLQPDVTYVPVASIEFLQDSPVVIIDFLQDSPVVPEDFLQDILPKSLKLERFYLEIFWQVMLQPTDPYCYDK